MAPFSSNYKSLDEGLYLNESSTLNRLVNESIYYLIVTSQEWSDLSSHGIHSYMHLFVCRQNFAVFKLVSDFKDSKSKMCFRACEEF